jgi:hypothetical protein
MDIEHPARAGHQLRPRIQRLLDGLRQTGGSRKVVSLLAVGDRHVHQRLLQGCSASR